MNSIIKSEKIILVALATLFVFCFAQKIFAQKSSENLAEKVTAAISSRYDPSNVNVTVKDDGWVTLTGKASLLYNKDRIYEIASHIYGVKRITNDILVVPETVPGDKDPAILPDSIIEENVIDLIGRNDAIEEPQNINIHVDNSLVILSGKVHFYREKILAETIASQVKGVNAIENDIKIVPIQKAMKDQDIKDVLISVLKNEFPLVNRDDINIGVNNGTVTVGGTVSNLWVKNNIGKEFSSIEGVTGVVNNLKVNPEMRS